MDYNDNDYEGQNLHLAGEESSKISVLRPFALPKFDFDDSLHGHLRFDSLVENEVFLGIPSQEDNHWIEDFSRGGNGIEFSSSAAESCALPRHINVWSEATSSESVEMLLKAVGQEEMVPGENMIEESDPGHQLVSTTSIAENELKDAHKVDDVENENPSLPPAEVGGSSFSSNLRSGIKDDHTEYTLQVQEVGIDNKDNRVTVNTGISSFDVKEADNNQGETCGLVDESQSHQMQENQSVPVKEIDNTASSCGLMDGSQSHQIEEDLSVPVKEIENTESSCRNFDVSSRESVDQVTISSISFSSSCTVKGTFNPIEEQDKGLNENNARFGGVSVETDNVEKHCSHETTSSMQSPEEEHTSDAFISTAIEASNMHEMGASRSKDEGCNKVTIVAEPTNCNEHSSVSGSEIKQLSRSDNMLPVVPPGGVNEGLGMDVNDAVNPAVIDNNEMQLGPGIQSPDRHNSLVGREVASADSIRSLHTSCATSGPTMLHEVLDDRIEKDHRCKTDDAAGPGKSLGSTPSSECCEKSVTDAMVDARNTTAPREDNVQVGDHEVLGDVSENDHDHKTDDAEGNSGKLICSTVSGESCEKSVTDDMLDARNTAAPQKDNAEDVDSAHPPLVGESIWTSKEDIATIQAMQADAHESDVNMSAHEKDSEKLPPDLHEMVFDDAEKQVGLSISAGELEVQKTTGSKPDCSVESDPALNTEVEGLASSCIENAQLVESCEHNDHSKETKSDAPKEPSPSVAMESMHKDVLSPATEINKDAIPASAVRERKTSLQSVSLLDVSCVNIPDEASTELSEIIEHPAGATVAQNDGLKGTPSKEQLLVETERYSGRTSSKLSVTGGIVEIDKPCKDVVPSASCTVLSQSEVNKQTSLEKNETENFGETLNISETSGVDVPCKEDETFTFDTRPLGGRTTEDAGKGLQSFPGLQACKIQPGKGLPAASVISQTDTVIIKETSHDGTSTPDVCPPSGSAGPPSERKSKRGSTKSGKGSLKKGNIVKETSTLKHSEKGDRSSPFFSPLGAGQLMTFESGVKPMGSVSIPTSSLPDLNTSAPSSSFFQQPFTDLQQVQLRAQIFVYGSLIQGAAPDEACMVSAFGMSDAGRSAWERSWRACVERLHGQKSQGNNSGTPLPPRSGAKAPDQTNRQVYSQSEVLSSIASRPSNKAIPSPVNPVIPLSSPLWNISTSSGDVIPPGSLARNPVIDYQALSPMNPYQTPPIRNYIAHSTWPAHTPAAPFPVPWLASSQSSPYDISSSYPAFPITEPVKLTAVKESSLPITSTTKLASPIPTTNTGATIAGASSLDLKKVKASTGQTGDTKTRKRKKTSGSEDVLQIAAITPLSDAVSAHAIPSQLSNKAPVSEDFRRMSLISQSHVGLVPTSVVDCYSTSVAVSTPSSFAPKGPNQAFPVVSLQTSGANLSKEIIIDKKGFNTEGFSKVEEAKLQAQEAAAHAADAVSHCESVWSQLDLQKSSGLTSDAESKLASAAAAIAAAASVAKAAAAAAKIASDAAVQAKQIADEALSTSGTSNTSDYDSNYAYNSLNLVNASSTSILKDGDRNNAPSLVISAAREAARKRIEAASAATRHAENLDAILKAAELAAEAVAHAGKVVAMGDPFSLSALAEAGPSNYWKAPQVASLPGSKSKDTNKDKSITKNAVEVPNVYNQHGGLNKNVQVTGHNMSLIQTELSRNTSGHVLVEENLVSSVKHGENSSRAHHDQHVSDSAKTMFVVSDQDMGSKSNLSTTSFRDGSRVEVLKDRGDSKKAWFAASVLSLKDGEALICYDGLQSDEGSEQLKELISIEAKDNGAPIIRVPHPMTGIQFEGTRKRRRAAVKDYTWSVGDRVDVWVQDCWREGIISEKNEKDASSLSVHFPVQGDTLAVKVWHLRPSLIWTDGEWIEWCRPEQDGTHQGDTPIEKRPKLGYTAIEAKGKAKIAKNIDFAEVGGNEEANLPLLANEKAFNIGSTREENKLNMVRTMRSGLEKEGSRVVFGVPKPGKKRKFMEVSKHYVSDRISKTNAHNDSVKSSKLMPQGSGSRGFRNSSKLDSKEKQVADSKPKTLKSGKPPSIPSRSLARKDDSTSSRSNIHDAASSDHTAKGSTSNDENESSEQNLAEVDEASRGAMLFSSQELPQGTRKKAVRHAKFERLHQGKLAPAGRKPAKDEEPERLISEVGEPRRSNRRIQPTSRLLEGLQSSLIISKIPSSSHDKGYRSNNKSTGRGNNNRG